jgi:uncharacterized protein
LRICTAPETSATNLTINNVRYDRLEGLWLIFHGAGKAGVPPILANATNATALWPGTVASVGAYRRELAVQRRGIVLFSAISLVGGLIGALLLLQTQERTFEQLIPYLLLAATLIFALSPRITRWTRQRGEQGRERWSRRLVVLALYFGVAIYGGFFGAGQGLWVSHLSQPAKNSSNTGTRTVGSALWG